MSDSKSTLRDALGSVLESEEGLENLKELVREAINAKREQKVDCEFSCKNCGTKQRPRIYISVPDWNARKNFLQLAIEHFQGRAAQAPAPPKKTKSSGRSFEEMSDEELQALLEDSPNGETDSSPTEEAA